jgi:hypothetical protein
MAARKHLSHDEKTRARIQTSQLINRLELCALGELELPKDKLKAIEILLKKSLPDLSSIQLTGDVNHRVGVLPASVDDFI